jgi:hypothetical protein
LDNSAKEANTKNALSMDTIGRMRGPTAFLSGGPKNSFRKWGKEAGTSPEAFRHEPMLFAFPQRDFRREGDIGIVIVSDFFHRPTMRSLSPFRKTDDSSQ